MMSSKPASNCRDLVAHGKMPRLQKSVGDPVLPGFPSSQSLPRYAHEEPTNYSGAYYSMCLGGQERRDLSAHWNPSRTCMQSGRNPIFFPSSANRALPNHILHRTEHMAFPVEKSPPMEQKELAAQQKMPFYDRSPEKLSPGVPRVHTPVAVKKTNVEGTNVSPQTETSVGLAIPKPVYGRNVCCAELGCSSGPSYSTERGDARIHPPFCDEEWMLQCSPLSILQRKDQEALMQRKVLELEHSRRQSLKEAQLDGYLPMRPTGPTRMPAFAEQNYSRFPYADSAHSMLAPPGQPYHRLPSKMYHSLPSSIPCTYEEMQLSALPHSGVSSKLYPDHTPPAPSHPQCPPHPAFYYPQGGTKVANSAQYSDRGGSNRQDPLGSISKQHIQNPSGPYRVPHSVFSNIPAPCPITQQSHSFVQHCEVPPYQLYKTHTSPGQKRAFSDGPGSTVSFAEQLEDYSLLKAQLQSPSRALCGQGFGSSAFHPVLPRFDHGSDSQESIVVLDGGLSRAQVTAPHSIVSQHRGERAVTDLINGDSGPHPSCVRVYTNEQSSETSRAVSSESHTLNQKEDNGLFDVQSPRKPDEDDQKLVDGPSSPPMPVINNVFSLAPYKAYLEATGMLSAPNVPDRGDPELGTSRIQPDIQINERDAQQASMPKDVLISFGNSWSSQEEAVNIRESKKIKVEPNEEEVTNDSFKTDQTSYQGVHCGLQEICKEEPDVRTSSSSPDDDVLDLSVKKSDSHESSCKLQTLTGGSEDMGPSSEGHGTAGACEVDKNPALMQTPPKPSTPPFSPSDKKFRFQHIPPEYLKLSAFKIVVPDTLRAPCSNTTDLPSDSKGLEGTKPLPKPNSHLDSSRRPRHHFMELHQSLCRLISRSVSHTPELDLRAWFDNKDRGLSAPSHTKTQRVSCLLGVEVMDLWLKCNDTAAVFHQVIRHMESFVSNCRCPFPHVVRAGMLFIPMLIVKESLFPQVPGAFIDQVLQERRVELRPTTLSEERHLAQLQKRACSSKLRRLLSLKHLPEVYPDVLNLFYHVCVSKRLGTELGDSMKKEPSRGKDTDMSCRSHVRTGCGTPSSSEKLNNSASLKKRKRNGRRMSDSKRLFSGENIQQKNNAEPSGKFENWSIVSSFCENGDSTQSTCEEGMENIQIKVEEESSDLEQAVEGKPDKAWGPVMSDEVSSGDSDMENDRTSTISERSQSSDSTKPSTSSRVRSGMILKLRKVLFDTGSGKYDSGFQPICDTGHCGQSGINARKIIGEQGRHQERSQRIRAGEAQDERGLPPGATGYTYSSSKAMQHHRSKKSLCMSRPLVQVKYCSYLSSGHNKQHRRWVLRSAVRTARRAIKNHYPELVGKRICHLYEEKDKSEVWYKGQVVRIHEPHPNPLKTVFEVKYDSEPEWQYYLELLMDYKKGWLKVED
uniref:Uncharacterized protein n=1 Tax=Paramormyrops kingsleyae TaxID=1676925 RepID=A0A3B3S0C0_9TELE|nr:uncharacterized protein C15orf39 homolog [Paramormyrops kingsleyae]